MARLRTLLPDRIRRSYALKFGLALVLLTVLVLGVGSLATGEMQRVVADNVEQEFTTRAQQEAQELAQWNRGHERFVTWLAQSSVMRDGQARVVQYNLETFVATAPNGTTDIHYVDANNGTVLASTNERVRGTALDGVRAPWTDSLSATEGITTTTAYESPVDGDPTIAYVRHVEGQFGRFVVVTASTSGQSSRLNSGAENGVTLAVGQSNRVLFDGHGANYLQTYDGAALDSSRPSDVGFAIVKRASGLLIDDAYSLPEKTPYVVSYAPVDGTDWLVFVHAPRADVFELTTTVRTYGQVLTLAVVVLIGLVGATLGRSTTNAIDDLAAKTAEMEQGNLDVELSTHRIDNIGQLYDRFDSMRRSLKAQIAEAERAREEAEVSRAETMEVNEYLESQAETYSDVMAACARGDLTQRMETDGENEAMDRIATSFNEMLAELEKTVGQLQTFADDVAESGETVEHSADTVRTAAEQVAESIQKISDDAHGHRATMQSLVEDVHELAALLDDSDTETARERLADLATDLETAAEAIDSMMAETETVAGAAEEQAAELNKVSARADELKRYAKPLGDILNKFDAAAEHEFVYSSGPGTDDESE